MIVNFQPLQDTLIAIGSLVGIVVLFAVGILAAAALSQRDKARHTRPSTPVAVGPQMAQHPTQSDDRELVLR